MPRELLYTSAPRGLLPGRSGYCTVAATAGLSPSVIQQLERLGGYLCSEAASAPDQAEAFSHWRMAIQGKTHSVLSRVTAAGSDYTGRLKREIYHLILDPPEHPAAGPIWLMSQPGVMEGPEENGGGVDRSAEPRWIRHAKSLPFADADAQPCRLWEVVAGDAGWAGIFAADFALSAANVSYLMVPHEVSPLALLAEAILLLPPPLRWKVSFNTYFSTLPADLACSWRCVPAHSSLLTTGSTKQRSEHVVLNLAHVERRAPNTPASQAARDGRLIPSAATLVNSAERRDQKAHG